MKNLASARTSFWIALTACGVISANGLLFARDVDDVVAINAHLKRFDEHPAQVMNEAPERWKASGAPVQPQLRFSPEAIESGAAIAARDRQRARMCMQAQGKTKCLGEDTSGVSGPREKIQGNDRPEDLVDGGDIDKTTLEAMERAGLLSSSLSKQPWSDDYWGTYKGILGARYADPRFPATQGGSNRKSWRANRDYILDHPARSIISSGDADAIDRLSPSEKYELLIGDRDGILTANQWQQGKNYYDSTGEVETWIGICHGWAQAAVMLPRAEHGVTVSAPNSRAIHFYPSDAKGLASLLWAAGSAPSRFVGGRCNVKHPRQDSNGRVMDQDCFDTNPGTWHLAVTHQIGIAHRSFILDASYDFEVWNQPVQGYKYRYFNPQTMYTVNSLAEARVPMSRFTHDRFSNYRSSRADAVVGVVMDLSYVSETQPSHSDHDSNDDDDVTTVRYYYDLELDSNGRIIGGEWYNNKHPDFLWVPVPGSHAVSNAENWATGQWSGDGPLPDSWRRAAFEAENSGQPLGKIVERLLSLAQGQ